MVLIICRRTCLARVEVWWTRMNHVTLLIAAFSIALFPSYSEGTKRRVWPAHYAEFHRELHRQLRETTHSHLLDFEVVIPSATDNNFRHLSHHVRHKRSSRVRRDVTDDVLANDESYLRYSLSGFGQEFQLHLQPNHRLIAPGFTIKRKKRGVMEQEELERSNAIGCHYHGRLVSHGGRMVAVSTCNGLTGLLRTEEDDFLLEPVPAHINHSFDHPIHPHVLYKRRHLDKENNRLHYCGKKHHYPVSIPESAGRKTINVLSNGEIELEDPADTSASNSRKRRSVDFPQRSVGFSENDLSYFSDEKRPVKKTVETLVVADRDMIRNHEVNHRDITTYVLTVMNVVSGLFLDHTLDGEVNIALVGLMLMEDNEGLHLDHKADRSLYNFCKWQAALNNSGGNQPDHSILLTGIDICVKKNSPCETLGLAQIGGMCNKRHSCSINEDNGLGLAFTVAHETGHSFGMKHDGQSNHCSKSDGHIMSPYVNGVNGQFTWSACSREALSDFLNDMNSLCLDDHPFPVGKLDFPNQLPGETYDAEAQCKMQFGANARMCQLTFAQESLCQLLWCQMGEDTRCRTTHMPAAEGTSCASKMWCRRGACVAFGSDGPDAVDGAWGDYGAWSSCTRSCGGGVQLRKRRCDNPAPQYGGRHCEGKDKTYQLCNNQECPPSEVDFRGQQCAEFNRKPYRRQYFTWVPFTKYSTFGRGQCELLCKAEGYDFFDMLADRVIDGTPCEAGSSDVCIEGKCEHVGCDNVLGSNATYDMCGVCNGDNTTCETVTGEYLQADIEDSGYYEVGRIPRGARNIRIWEEACCTHSYVAIKSAAPPFTYQLNGNWQVDLYGKLSIAGVMWAYTREAYEPESLYTAGPIMEDIVIEVLIVARNPGIRYSYASRKADQDSTKAAENHKQSQHRYQWRVSYSHCSASCAGGTKFPEYVCVRDDLMPAEEKECSSIPRPSASSMECNANPCPARWEASDWGTCSRSCGGGLQTRHVSCKALTSKGETFLQESECATLQKPIRSQNCHLRACPAQWQTGAWSKCSRDCGRGIRTRSVRCRSGLRMLRKSACNRKTRPKSRMRCLVAYCQRKYQWFITAWKKCSTTCGNGVQRRELKCTYKRSNGQYRPVSQKRCKRVRKPRVSLQKVCSLATCPSVKDDTTSAIGLRSGVSANHYDKGKVAYGFRAAKWIAGTWQKCSVSCGGGFQVRVVKCFQAGRTSNSCSQQNKPSNRRSCNTYQCSLSANNEKPSTCTDSYTWCYLVPQHGQCSHSYFGAQCCKACSSAG